MFFFDNSGSEACRPLIDEGYTVKLDVLRGVRDHFYIAQSNGKATLLFVIKFDLNFEITREKIYEAEEILAIAIDSSLTTDNYPSTRADGMHDGW